MPTLAAKIAVAAAATVLTWAGIEAVRLRHVAAAAPSRTLAEADNLETSEVPRLAPVTVGTNEAKEPPAEVPAALGIAAMARIHGRVLSGEHGEGPPEVSAEDSSHTYDAEVEADGRFEINLPAGTYTLIAAMDDLVATADVAGLDDGEDREVTLVLSKGAEVQGTVHGPDGTTQAFEIQVHRAGRPQATLEMEGEKNGQFSAEGLIPGLPYDLTVTTPGMRRLVVRNVMAPRRGLDLALEPTPTLRGGFGVAAGEECPMKIARLVQAGADQARGSAPFNRACHFEIDDLPDAASVHVTAEGKGWHFEAEVAVPNHGDPPFLCLREPCRNTGPEPTATLAVTLQGARASGWYLSANSEGKFRGESCQSSQIPCQIDDLEAGNRVDVRANASGLRCETKAIDLVPGMNTLVLPCQANQMIQGVFASVPSGEDPEPTAMVRCSASEESQRAHGRLFQIECLERLPTIEYQRTRNGPWMTAPIQSSGPGGIGFVEIL